MIGSEIIAAFKRRVNTFYVQSYAIGGRMDSLFNESLQKTVEVVYKSLDSQPEYDFLRNIITTDNVYALANNKILISDIDDYLHLLLAEIDIVESDFESDLTSYTISNTQSSLNFKHHTALRSYEKITVTGVASTLYAKYIANKKYEVYADYNLKTVADLTTFTAPLTVNRIVTRNADQQRPNQKGLTLSQPILHYPKYEIADGYLKFNAGGSDVVSMKIDYLKDTAMLFDFTDDDTEYSDYYPDLFIRKVIDTAVKLYADETQNPNLEQTSQVEKIVNQ